MLALIHSCGARIEQEPAGSDFAGRPTPLFADSVTLDPISHCPHCGADLALARVGIELMLASPTGQRLAELPKAKRRPSSREGAVKLLRQAVRQMQQRQARAAA